jgi:hypothetical protein
VRSEKKPTQNTSSKSKRQRPGGAVKRRTSAEKAADNRLKRLGSKPTTPLAWSKYVSSLRVIVGVEVKDGKIAGAALNDPHVDRKRLRAKLVLKSLSDHADDDGFCEPSQATAGITALCSRQAVYAEHLPRLIEAGYVRAETNRRNAKKRFLHHGYQIVWPAPEIEFAEIEGSKGVVVRQPHEPVTAPRQPHEPVTATPEPRQVHEPVTKANRRQRTKANIASLLQGQPRRDQRSRQVSDAQLSQDASEHLMGSAPDPAAQQAAVRNGNDEGQSSRPTEPRQVHEPVTARDNGFAACPPEARYLLDVPPDRLVGYAKPGDLDRFGFTFDDQGRLIEKPPWYPFPVFEVAA